MHGYNYWFSMQITGENTVNIGENTVNSYAWVH